MKMSDLLNKHLVEQKYFGLYRLLIEQPDDAEKEEGPNIDRLRQNLLDVLTAWRHENPKATVIPLDKFMASVHDPVIDIDPIKDKQFIIDTLSGLDEVVREVSPNENKIYLVGSMPKSKSSEEEEDKQIDRTKEKAQKALHKAIKEPVTI